MRPPLSVCRTLGDWKYHPVDREDFGMNFLARQVHRFNETEPDEYFASVCAVPRGLSVDRVQSVREIDSWLDPVERQYDPPGIWIPRRSREGITGTSHGFLRAERWEERPDEYLHVGFDGYVEFGRIAGFTAKESRYFSYSPIVAWIQRMAAFVSDLRALFDPAPEYWLVLNLRDTTRARLSVLGKGWRDPVYDAFGNDGFPMAVEPSMQMCQSLAQDAVASDVARWFAERLAVAFGIGELTCYNGVGDEKGELGRAEF